MPNPIKTLVLDYGWIHLGLGSCGNVLFLLGGVAFLPRLHSFIPPWLDHRSDGRPLASAFSSSARS